MNRQFDEEFRRIAERRNRGDARLTYRWTAWRRTSSGLEELEAPASAWPDEIGGVACELGAARSQERRDGAPQQDDTGGADAQAEFPQGAAFDSLGY